jgi:hypothetical protein
MLARLEGALELNYENLHVSLRKRPSSYTELLEVLAKLSGSIKNKDEVIIEYYHDYQVRPIFSEVALQEAYVLHEQSLVIGVRTIGSRLSTEDGTI